MRVLTSLVAMLALLVTHSPARADNDAVKKEIAKLQGTWQLVSSQMVWPWGEYDSIEKKFKSRTVSTKGTDGDRMIVKDKTFSIVSDGKTQVEGTYEIVEVEGKVRKTNVTFTKGEGMVGSSGFTLAKWLSDDSFQTCFSFSQRPTEFTFGELQPLMTFKRVKK